MNRIIFFKRGVSALLYQPAFFIRNSIKSIKREKKNQQIENTNEKDETNIEIINLTSNLKKDLGLKLKINPKFQKTKLSKLEEQLEEFNLNQISEKTDPKIKKGVVTHSIRNSSKNIKSLESKNLKSKKEKEQAESKLEAIDTKITSQEDPKQSPNEILMRFFEKTQNKKKEKTEAELNKYLGGEEGIDYMPTPPMIEQNLNEGITLLKNHFNDVYEKFMNKDISERTKISKSDWIEEKQIMEVYFF